MVDCLVVWIMLRAKLRVYTGINTPSQQVLGFSMCKLLSMLHVLQQVQMLLNSFTQTTNITTLDKRILILLSIVHRQRWLKLSNTVAIIAAMNAHAHSRPYMHSKQ